MSLFHLSSTKNSESTQEKTVAMEHQQPGWVHSHLSEPDATFQNADTNDTADDFFSRPVKIATFDWPVNTDFFVSLDPWSLFWENPRVANKLSNFKKMRCDMVVDILVNGNPFYYGSIIAAMSLLPSYDQQTIFRPGEEADIVNASQRPHVYLDPTRSEGGQLYVPFFYPKDAIDIPSGEWREMGRLNMASIVPLQHAAGATESITITVLAYCKNVHISTPTNRPPGFLVAQSGDGEAEFGLVSGPSSAIAKASGMLANIPIIRPYALAAQMGASTVSKIAKLFGFSRPIYAEEPMMYTARPTGHLSTTNVSSNSTPLSFDIKKQVTVDPRTVGLSSNDEMAILPLAMRESYVTTFPWSRSSPPDSHLFSIGCTPMHGLNFGSELHITPSAWVCTPFRYWKGSMRFRFKIVCSNFHRGRLRFAWDPDFIENTEEFNTNYSEIVDISNMTDLTLTIGWGQTTAYLTHSGPESVPNHSTIEFTNKDLTANGVLSVFVVNELTAPADAPSNIDIVCFQSMGEDFEVACPDSRFLETVQSTTFPDEDNPGDEGGDTGGDGTGDDGAGNLDRAAEMVRTPAATLMLGIQQPDPIADSIPEPQHSDLDNLQNSVLLTNNISIDATLQYFSVAAGEVVGAPVIFEFSNPAAQTLPITVTVNGNSYSGTLPGSGGGTVSIVTEPLNFAADLGVWKETPINISSTGGFSRFRLDRITSSLPTGAQSERLEPNDILALAPNNFPNPNTVDNGAFVQNIDRNPVEITMPGDYSPGSKVVVATTTNIQINNVNYTNTNRRGKNGAMMIPVEPIGGVLTLEAIENPAITEEFRILRIYYVSGAGEPQSGVPDPLNSVPSETGAPHQEEEHQSMGPIVDPSNINLVHFGETITSLRQVMKRHETWFNYFISQAANTRGTIRFPLRYENVDTTEIKSSVVPAFHWFALGFLGERGGKRVMVSTSTTAETLLSLSRLNLDDFTLGFSGLVGSTLVPEVRWDGTAMSHGLQNSMLQADFPWYSRFRFGLPRSERTVLESLVTTPDYARMDIATRFNVFINCRGTVAVAAADDYSLFYFHGTPVFVRL